MQATRLKGQGTDEVCLLLPKGVLVILTTEEYVRGLNRGKARRRAERHAATLQRQQARAEAQCLAWLEDT